MAKKRGKHPLDLEKLAGAIQALLTIEGVEGIGQPVTLLSLGDLPSDVLGFVERLRGGVSIETDEEMLLITLTGSAGKRHKRQPTMNRLREALILLCRYAVNKGGPAAKVAALLDDVKDTHLEAAHRAKELRDAIAREHGVLPDSAKLIREDRDRRG